jgi:hypothetical protein
MSGWGEGDAVLAAGPAGLKTEAAPGLNDLKMNG